MHAVIVLFFSTLCTPYYDNQYNPLICISITTINEQILHPCKFNLSDYTGADNYELWNKGNKVTTYNNNIVYKTIYSPSPVDYVEPKPAAFTGFTSTGNNSNTYNEFNVSNLYSKGWNFYCQLNRKGTTFFLSALGYRNRTDMSLVHVNIGCHYYSAGPYSSTMGSRPYIDANSVNILSYCNRSYAISVRSVHE